MKTNDIFNFRRFGKYLASDLKACSANFGLSALLISLCGVLLYILVTFTTLIFDHVWEGPTIGERATCFLFAMAILVMTMPTKTYGHITDKRAGSSWLMLPASRFEKMLSMLTMTVVILPVILATAYLAVDAIICAVDGTCGKSIASFALNIRETIAALMENEVMVDGVTIVGSGNAAFDFIRQMTCPWLYVDDIIGLILAFLLGAIFFKTGKSGKTILAIFIFGIGSSIIMGTALGPWAKGLESIVENDPQQVFNLWIFRHAALYDTINDSIVNIALLLGIWFRIKTLKH